MLIATIFGPNGTGLAAPARTCDPSAQTSGVSLEDVTAEVNAVTPLVGMLAHAVAWGDVNGDDWPDLFVGTYADRPRNKYAARGASGPVPDRLLLGGPNGFRTSSHFPTMHARTASARFVDLDGDDDLDLVLGRAALPGTAVSQVNTTTVVLRNDHGSFTIAAKFGRTQGVYSIGVLDEDDDGRPDLFLTDDHFGERGTSVLLHNEGKLRFRDVTRALGLPNNLHGLGVSTADLNQDGRADLLVTGNEPADKPASSQVARIFLHRAKKFVEVDASEFKWQTYGNEDDADDVAVGDLNDDGVPDVVIGEHYGSTLGRQGTTAPVHVYLNTGLDPRGRPRFDDVTEASGIPAFHTKSPDVEIVDFDGDGRPDIVTTASAADGTTPAILRNLGATNGVPRFATPAGLGNAQYWAEAAVADFDRDGRPDLALAEFDDTKPSLLLRNATGDECG